MKQSKLAFEPFHSPAVGVMGSDDLDKRRQMWVAKFFVITCLIIIFYLLIKLITAKAHHGAHLAHCWHHHHSCWLRLIVHVLLHTGLSLDQGYNRLDIFFGNVRTD